MTAALAALLVAAHPAQTTPPLPFGRDFKVEWVVDGYWSHCELVIVVDAKGSGTVETTCRFGELKPQDHHLARQLTADEVGQLRSLLRAASLFDGQFWGLDMRGIDMGLTTPRVETEHRVAVLVCSSNDSFSTGPRMRLANVLSNYVSAVAERKEEK